MAKRSLVLLLLLVGTSEASWASQGTLSAPWRGKARISQGNHGSASHNVCGHRTLQPSNCLWENTYALDLALAIGTDVVAPADGEVHGTPYDGVTGPGGRQLVLKHTGPDGATFYTAYLHLSEIKVWSGKVTRGMVIAKSGQSSGGQQVYTGMGAHLHFHIWSGSGSPDSHTVPMEALRLKRVNSESSFRSYSSSSGDLDNSSVAGAFFESDNNGSTNVDGAFSVLAADWNHDGVPRVWQFSGGVWTVPASDGGPPPFTMGVLGDVPIVGDWDGDGLVEVGIFRANETPSAFYLDVDRVGGADWTVPLAGHFPDDVPVVGDWDGDGDDDIGAWNAANGKWYLFTIDRSNPLAPRAVDLAGGPFFFGEAGRDVPIVGDWDRDGRDDVGLLRPRDPTTGTNNFIFRLGYATGTIYSLTAMPGGIPGGWGNVGDVPLIADWNNDGYDEIGLYRPGVGFVGYQPGLPHLSPLATPLPGIHITSPDGAEAWTAGATKTLTWATWNLSPGATLGLWLYDGFDFHFIQDVAASSTSLSWTVPNLPTSQAQLYLWSRVNGVTEADDWSNSTFSILPSATSQPQLSLVSPNGGETWAVGSTHTIAWTSQNLDPAGWIEIYLDVAGVLKNVAVLSAGTTSRSWVVPDDPSSQARIALYYFGPSSNYSDAIDASAAPFAISSTGPTPRTLPVWHSFFAVNVLETPYVGDFDGDGKTDLVTFTRQNPSAVGDVYVALSDGTKFGPSAKWHDWFAITTDETVVIGDFDGDGKDDIATWLGKTTGQVYVAKSTGSGMNPAIAWLGRIGQDPSDVILAGDANGDGRADLIDFARKQGKVYVALSTGSSFEPPTVWHDWFAVSTFERPRVADLNGDGRADIVTFATSSPTAFGDVYVAASNGSRFVDLYGAADSSSKWHDWFAIGPQEEIGIGDLDGDGRQDFFTFLPPPWGQGYTALSQGTSMAGSVLWPEVVTPLPTDRPCVGDVNGDGKADVIVFAQGEGKVYVSLAW